MIRATVTKLHNLEPQHEVESIEWNQQSEESGSDSGADDAFGRV